MTARPGVQSVKSVFFCSIAVGGERGTFYDRSRTFLTWMRRHRGTARTARLSYPSKVKPGRHSAAKVFLNIGQIVALSVLYTCSDTLALSKIFLKVA